MKYLVLSFIAFACWSCGSKGYTKAEDAQDAGRQFIRASLDGDIEKARFYLLKDSANLYLLNTTWKRNFYDKLSNDDRQQYRSADIRPIQIDPVSDSLVNYIYTNSYKEKDTTVISIVRMPDGDKFEWLVDLKHIHRWNH
ncbi:MAG: hypothetical protein P0Y53_11735 [Candidatus Pseudobacter hemicellulosilyticus]|uniref:Uncharacterized protein n=1 Tax=Candidatus Pseudobacter hemicellulosilyticus TaxID=3121375 RepID=A0AAJ6BJD3_9BACT|nr:MAG: hypothetical protein P0Y53_11735 [Pseudobacter sp.]